MLQRHSQKAALALAFVLCASVVSSVAVAAPPESPAGPADAPAGLASAPGAPGAVGDRDLLELLRQLVGSGPTIGNGADGRLTILLLGSDYRPNYHPGERTDVMMVVSLNPATKRLTVASVPRDTVYFPRAPQRGGSSGAERVNMMYDGYGVQPGYDFEPAAMAKFKEDMAYVLGVEIDYYAFIRFTGFDAMIDQINGLKVKIKRTVLDPIFQDEPSAPFGVFFPRDTSGNYALRGRDKVENCPDTSVTCHRAIVYVRSRKGADNSDYHRVRRQQDVVYRAIQKVAGFDNTALALLLEASKAGTSLGIETDMPRGLADALYLRGQLTGATLAKADRVVFAADTYATSCCNLPRYTYKLKLKAVRSWIDAHMPRVP